MKQLRDNKKASPQLYPELRRWGVHPTHPPGRYKADTRFSWSTVPSLQPKRAPRPERASSSEGASSSSFFSSSFFSAGAAAGAAPAGWAA